MTLAGPAAVFGLYVLVVLQPVSSKSREATSIAHFHRFSDEMDFVLAAPRGQRGVPGGFRAGVNFFGNHDFQSRVAYKIPARETSRQNKFSVAQTISQVVASGE